MSDIAGQQSERLTLWGRLSSCNVQKAVWVLEELALPYQRIDAGGNFGGLDDPAYRAMNPHGKVPTLRDGGTVVWESDAIIRYLAARYGENRLWSVDPAKRAQVDQWLAWANASLYRDWIDLFWMCVRTPSTQQDHAGIETRRRRCAERFAFLDTRLAEHPFVTGNQLTLADIAVGMTLYRWYEMPIERDRLPNLEAYYARLRQRPAFVTSVCVPFDDLKGKLAF